MGKYKESLIKLLNEVTKTISEFSEKDLKKWIDGDLELSIHFTFKKKASKKKEVVTSDTEYEKVLKTLQTLHTRDDGILYLTKTLPSKNLLEKFARHIDVPVNRKDKIDQLKERIVEATTGAIIRSKAIQG